MTTRVPDVLLPPGTHASLPASAPKGALRPCTTDGKTHQWDGTTWTDWKATPSFASLSDVDLTGLTNGNVPVWDSASSKWKPGSAGGATSPRTKIADVTLTAVAASIDFSSIPATYDDLEVLFYGKHATVTTAVSMRFTLNNDTTDANYKRSYQYADSTASGGNNVADRVTAQVNGTGPTVAHWLIPRYADTTFQKGYGSEVFNGGSSLVQYGSLWANTAAINRLTLTLADGLNFAIGTRVRVYGLKDI